MGMLCELSGEVESKRMMWNCQAMNGWLVTSEQANTDCRMQIVKCDNEECCAAPRSVIKNVLPGGFMPAPFAVTNIHGLKTADVDELDCRFMSLFQRMSVNLQPGDSLVSSRQASI